MRAYLFTGNLAPYGDQGDAWVDEDTPAAPNYPLGQVLAEAEQAYAAALDLGVDIINDVGGLADTAMLEILEEHDNDVVVMHALDVPVNPAHTLPEGCDVVAEILACSFSSVVLAVALKMPELKA